MNGQPTSSAQIVGILQKHLFSTTLNCIHENYLTFGITKEIMEQIETTMLKQLLTNEQFRPRVRFARVNDEVRDFKAYPCFSKVYPSLSSLNFHPKSGKTRPGKGIVELMVRTRGAGGASGGRIDPAGGGGGGDQPGEPGGGRGGGESDGVFDRGKGVGG